MSYQNLWLTEQALFFVPGKPDAQEPKQPLQHRREQQLPNLNNDHGECKRMVLPNHFIICPYLKSNFSHR